MKTLKGATSVTALLLVNCRSCDDFYRVHTDKPRSCLCGKSSFRVEQGQVVPTGPSRLVAIDWEDYDGAIPGEPRTWRIVSEADRSWNKS